MAEGYRSNAVKAPDGLDEPRLMEEVGPAARIARIAIPVLRDFGLRLVRVRISASAGATVQVMAERPDGTMSIDDCERASIGLSPVLDVEDVMAQAYRLELSSPGIDRPLVRLSDFERAVGHEARIEMSAAINGRKRFRGRIEAVEAVADEPVARLRVVGDDSAETSVELPIRAMSEARLVLTDDLIRASLRREKAALKEARRSPGRAQGARPRGLPPAARSNTWVRGGEAATPAPEIDKGDADGG